MKSFAEFQEQVKEQPDTEGRKAGGLDASNATRS